MEGCFWEVVWPCISVLEILQMRTAAQAWNDANQYWPYCELFFFLMKREVLAGSLFGQCDGMRAWSPGVLGLWTADEGHSVQGILRLGLV